MYLLTLVHLAGFALLATPSIAQPTLSTTAESPFATRVPPSLCGGLRPGNTSCPKGLVCAPTQLPGTYDMPGTCVLQSCGGKSSATNPCPTGQVCVYNATAPITDLPGRCMVAKLTCGGKEECKARWDCLENPKIDYNYRGEFEGKGICIPPGSLEVKEPWNGWGV